MNKIPYNPPTYMKGDENLDKKEKRFIKVSSRSQTLFSKSSDYKTNNEVDEKRARSAGNGRRIRNFERQGDNQKSCTPLTKDLCSSREAINQHILFKKRQNTIGNCIERFIKHEGKCQRRYSDSAIIIKKKIDVKKRLNTACISTIRRSVRLIFSACHMNFFESEKLIENEFFFVYLPLIIEIFDIDEFSDDTQPVVV
ncbi:DgyrCDS8807 [Dimorphilus gyrociliatus]|uniref:DgyrCDS8807 n=1 Tax=Dimorphilus gyrociliatus TaxID=2664684 RepID=A0A7I8W0E8_9ANNE|nr:DgyrCDS8807 [Dimorphilus gyrociliatus]